MDALLFATTGNFNTAVGNSALGDVSTGSTNIAVGFAAGSALKTGTYNIDIGNRGGGPKESYKVRIGTPGIQNNAYIAGIYGATVAAGVPVVVDGDGRLGTTTSSARFKEAIKPMDKSSEALLKLQPVTFRYKKDLDSLGIPQFGLVAEEVAKVDPDLVARDESGEPYTVRYEAVNAMLLNEFLKEHRKVEGLETSLAQERKISAAAIAELKLMLQEQALQLEKVSARLQSKETEPRLVGNR
ncbi:MAG: tail fiber domain-containing protein [Chthoniobacterales bacterium]|nr:tail fiber domain-containing protein [Chthoniobacterales bacterium]